MKVVSSKEMKDIEGEAISNIGIPSLSLMETASSKFSERCFDVIKKNNKLKIVVFVGKGNNGGDGLAFCRHIFQKVTDDFKIDIDVIFIGEKEKATAECKTQLDILLNLVKRNYPYKLHFINDISDLDFSIYDLISSADLVVDAIIGTGLKYDLRKNILDVVKAINENKTGLVASIDCPTGIDSDTGKVLGDAIMADFTVTFHLPKVGLMVGDGAIYSGEVFIEDINIPYGLENYVKTNVLTQKDVVKIIPKRSKNGNKGTFGKVFIFAGSDDMSGACAISAKSAYRTGSGLVYVYSTQKVCDFVRGRIPEVVATPLNDRNGYLFGESFAKNNLDFSKADSIVIGPAIGTDDCVADFIKTVFENAKSPIIVDADALNVISKDLSLFDRVSVPCIVTPHIGEMSRLTGLSISDIKKNIIEVARDFSQKYNLITVLKDFHTVIANPNGDVYINTTGCSALSKGGSGDCLTGVIASFIGQGVEPFYGAVIANFIFGLAGELIAKNKGEFGVLATETADYIPKAIEVIQKLVV